MTQGRLIFPGGTVGFHIIDDTHENVNKSLNDLCAEFKLKEDEVDLVHIERYIDKKNRPCSYIVVKYWTKSNKKSVK